MTALAIRNDKERSVQWTESAHALIADALESAALIGRVSNADENESAVEAQKKIRAVKLEIEKVRKQLKEPVLEFGRLIDATAKRISEPLDPEEIRIATLVGNFQQLEEAKRKAAEAARMAEISELERKRQEELAAATTMEAVDAIQERFNLEAAGVKPLEAPTRAAGQVVRTEWEIQEIREWELAKARPDLVRRIEFDRIEIKRLLDAGVKLPGVVAKPVVKSTVRASRTEIVNV